MEFYWFWIQPFTFIFQTKKEVMFYNSESGFSWLEKLNQPISGIVKELAKPENAYCISLSENDLKNKRISKLVEQLRNSFSGDIILQKRVHGKPFVFKPKLRLINDVDVLKNEKDRGIGDSVVQLLSEVSIYLNSTCSHNCKFCDNYCKQISYCYSDKSQDCNLDIDKLIRFLKKIEAAGVIKVIFSGGNIFSYPQLDFLLNTFLESHFKKVIQINYLNYPFENSFFNNYNIELEILVHFPIYKADIQQVIIHAQKNCIKCNWKFVVKDTDEYLKSINLINENLLVAKIKPFYNAQNIDFFINEIYLDKDDLKIEIPKRSIFAREKVNENDFGKIAVLADGSIFANLNHQLIGTIDDDIRELIYKEMDKGTSWRRIRDMKPCYDCVYQWLCPSPSNYELAIGKPNLCHVKP